MKNVIDSGGACMVGCDINDVWVNAYDETTMCRNDRIHVSYTYHPGWMKTNNKFNT